MLPRQLIIRTSGFRTRLGSSWIRVSRRLQSSYPRPRKLRSTWELHHGRDVRGLATQAGKGTWSALSPSEQAAWQALDYTKDSWEGRRSRPPWKDWYDLTLEEQAIVRNGLGIQNKAEWNALQPSSNHNGDIPSLESLLDGTYDDDSDDGTRKTTTTSNSALVAQETRALRKQQQQQQQSTSSPMVKMALNTAKGLAPIVGPLIRSAAGRGKGNQALGLTVVGSLLEQVPTLMDASSGMLDVTGIDTIVYLDDSGSMQGSNLYEAKKALESLEGRLKTSDEDRFLPTRIVKFGETSLVLNPSEEDWNVALVNFAWDGTSGGTYMWKMIEDDIRGKYRPVRGEGKLRVIVITDGADNLSPAPYKGVRGFDPLMQTLTLEGFDIEWHIVVVGNHSDSWTGTKEISHDDEKLYQSLCHATGGQFLSLGASGWDEQNDDSVATFLDAIEDSGYHDSDVNRRKRQEQYRLEASKGRAENFDWLPLLSTGKDDDNKK